MNSFQTTSDKLDAVDRQRQDLESTYVPTQMSSEDIGSNSTQITSRQKYKLPKTNYTKLPNYKKSIEIQAT